MFFAKNIKVPIKNLHEDLKGLRICQMSDLHVGTLIHKKYVQQVVDMVQSLKAHIIVLTGDLADGTVEALSAATEPLGTLSAPLGKFYVTGNHEYYWGVDEWTDRAQALGFEYLYNKNKVLKVGRSQLLLGGVADFSCRRIRPDHKSDPLGSISGSAIADLNVLLAHQPKSCFEAVRAGYHLQLSGHTHNGQFFPNSLFVRFFHPYVNGLHLHEGKLWVYVSAGTGFWGPPQRLGVPSEITCLELTQSHV